MPVGIDPKVDYAFKWLMGRDESSPILIDLLHAVLNPAPEEQIVDIQLLNPFSDKMALDDKLAVLDIKARDQLGRQFNVEMQMLGSPSLPQRVLYYWSKLYTEQLQSGKEYDALRPTISVCFVDGVLFPAIGDHHTCFRLVEPNHGVAFTGDIQIHLVELPKFAKKPAELATALDAWLYFLRHAQDFDLPGLPAPMDRLTIRRAMEGLLMLAHTDMQREVYEGRLKALRDERARLIDAKEQGNLIGRVEAYQDILGVPATPRAELEAMPINELRRLADDLRRRLGR